MKKLFFLTIALLLLTHLKAQTNPTTITNDVFWYTTSGKPIYSQGGGIFRFPDATTGKEYYYWYGVHYAGAETYLASPTGKIENSRFVSVTCYRSEDLVNWTFVGDVMTSKSLTGAYWLGRLGVAYIAEIKKYALLVQYNNSVLIATCDTPTGLFEKQSAIDMTSRIGTPNTGDQTVFTDDNGKSYLVYSYGKGRSKIYLSEIGVKDGAVTLLDCNKVYSGAGREGNCMFKYKGKYYICASDLYGWNASNVYYLESKSVYGPYTPTNDMLKMPGAENDYGHVTQTGFFYTVKGTKKETVIYCGDRWADFAGNGNGYNQWCPLSFVNNAPYFNSLSEWTLNAETGEWKVGKGNNYVKNGSFDADRVNIPSAKKPVQTYLTGWSFLVSKGNKIAVGGAHSPVLNASNSSTDRAEVTGNKCMMITDSVDFTRKIVQNIGSTVDVPLTDGTYILSAKVMSGGLFKELYMYAVSDNQTFKGDITYSDSQWHDLVIKNVVIKGGKVEIGFVADGPSNAWCKIDDVTLVNLQTEKQKTIDNGGSGLYKAVAVSEKSLPEFVVYRPKDLYWASTREKKLPVLIWGNGGCTDTSVGYERMLTEIASQGYIVIAIGELQMVNGDRKEVHTPSTMMADAMNWICMQVKDKNSDYYDCVDTTKMAAAGHSCGGAQVLFNAASPRLKTYIIHNAGMGDMEMAGASKSSLEGLHGPILYLTGGESDVAYKNAQLDYERISHVPVAYGDMSKAGHGGTYNEKGGGDFGRMLQAWLDWQLKGKTEQKNVFLESDLRAFPGWTMKQKNFGDDNTVSELWINNNSRKIYGIVSEPTSKEKNGVAIISHGFNGTHHFGRDYFKTLNELGYLVYTFDYPCGSVNSRSDNNTENMSVIDQKEDLKAIVHYFQNQPNVDKNKIVLIGESQGGFISALAAADLKEQVSRLILIYPALCIPDNWNQRYPKVKDIPEVTKMWNVPLGRRFFEQLRNIDVYKTITKYKGPVQIVHGSKDAVVPLSYSEKAMKQYADAHLGVIPGAGHGFKPEEREKSNQFVKEFLSK